VHRNAFRLKNLGRSYQTNYEDIEMAIRSLKVTITGMNPLLQNNPQTVDRFNDYTRAMAKINAKKTRRTDEDYRDLQDIEVRAKIYWDEDLGIYVPGTWMSAAIAAASFKKAKISKADIRGSVFVEDDKIKLQYENMNLVKKPEDIVGNPFFRLNMTLKQGQVRVVKAVPIFHKWSFNTKIEFDDKLVDESSLVDIIKHASLYGGFGDFRPTFGRAQAEVVSE
jgi:hypothetical protein